ncbi:beta-lactamase family protein [Streptomyces rectiverticillatus]|uniref:serine hydrolase domain-containing protein n=1 Tax=Streptomyces rectiverticillatus TaxID=173860 RepID=UPI0015C3CF92|nr:serine hydrolase domain-containing protein [Streptomyces rectiverticillatus]QLE75708.1 beta-lactamase family protein [Streptomyces rectiverticillatus]
MAARTIAGVGAVTALLVGGPLPNAFASRPEPTALAVQPERSGADTRAEVQRALDAMVRAGAPGVLARVDDSTDSWTVTSGVADLRTGREVPHDARFRIASLTKGVVATTVMRLAEEGRLELDRPVGDRLPGVVSGADRITVRQLLNHTGGLADYIKHKEFKDPADYGERTYRPEQLVALADALGAKHEPGPPFTYSNSGYIVLGMLIEKVTGHELADELRRQVLEPAGMTRTFLPLTDPQLHGPHATGYYLPAGADPQDPGALRPITRINPSFAWAAYGLVSDARDVNRFYQALFGGRLVRPASLEQMRTGVATQQAPVFPRYGLGLESAGLTCGEMWGGTGSIPGYETFAFADRDGTRRMILSINVQRNDPEVEDMILAGLGAFNQYFCGKPYAPTPR